MRWRGRRESSNVEDRRSQNGGLGGLGRSGRMPRMTGRRGGGLGLGTIVIGLIVAWLFGINPMTLLGMFGGGGGGLGGMAAPSSSVSSQTSPASGSPGDDMGKFVSVVLASTEDVWAPKFEASGSRYPAPDLVLFTGATATSCGQGSAASGPFYCPADRKVYIDLSFFQMMHQRLGAPGDFAQAYVIAHEVGHHIQNISGTMKKMDEQRRRLPKTQYNQLSVRLELQADCLAGIWARESQQASGWLESGDIEEAMNAAAAVGDDNMMRQSGAPVRPEHFTHGSAKQRAKWFNVGLQQGSVKACDTFSALRL
ncbi:MAG: KPN_02809 family neutral zinc metallopeptidase [Burkholderiaceae bacterium]